MGKNLGILMLSVLLLSGCTWVHLSPQGEQVRVVSEAKVADCKKIGVTTVSVMAKIGGVRRNKTIVAEELATLGRNSASEMGGDTIVPASEITGGEQSFDVYRCSNP